MQAASQLSLTEKRRQVLSRYGDWEARPTKLQRLTPSDASSVPRSSQNLHPRTETPTDTPTPPEEEEQALIDRHPTRRRRRAREVIYVPNPLYRLQTDDISKSFWQGALICYWGFVKPITSPDIPPADVCTDFDLLPVNWLNKMNDLAWEMGASIIIGGDEGVFSTILGMKAMRSSGCVLPSAIVHICRPYSGHLKLQKAWAKWMRKRGRRVSGEKCVTLAQSLMSPDNVSDDRSYPAPSELHRVATPLWLQLCVEDKHHYPETSFAFFQPPLGNAYTPLLFRSPKSPVRRLSVMLLGARGSSKPLIRGAEDYILWQAGIEHFLGGLIFPTKRLHLPSKIGDGQPQEMRSYAQAQADSIKFEPFCNFQGITSDLRIHDRSADLPDVVICLHGHNDVMNYVAQIGSTNLSRLQYNAKTTAQIMILLHAKIPFLTFRYITDCYIQTSVLPSSGYSLNDRLWKAVDTLVNNFQAVLPVPISGSNPGSAATSRASSRNPSTRPSLSGAQGGEWWKLNSESLFDTVASPEAVLEPRTPGVSESRMVWSQAFGREEVVSVTRGVSWAPDLPPLRLAVSPVTLADYPHFQDAAFQMLPVEKSAFLLDPFAHELWHIVASMETIIFAPIRDILAAAGTQQSFQQEVWTALVLEAARPLAYQPLEAGMLAEGLPGCRLFSPQSDRFKSADVCLLIMNRERQTLRMQLTLLTDNYEHRFTHTDITAHSNKCVGDLLAQSVTKYISQILKQTNPLQPEALLAIARLTTHLLRQDTVITTTSAMNIKGCLDIEILKRQDDFANVAKLLYAPQKPLADATINSLKETIMRITAKYICEHCLHTLEAAKENWPTNLQWRINAYREIVGTADTLDSEMDGTCATKSLDVFVEASQTALPPLEFEMSYGRQRSRQSLFNGNTDKMRVLEEESEKTTKRVISRLCAKWSLVNDAKETARAKELTEMLVASLNDMSS